MKNHGRGLILFCINNKNCSGKFIQEAYLEEKGIRPTQQFHCIRVQDHIRVLPRDDSAERVGWPGKGL